MVALYGGEDPPFLAGRHSRWDGAQLRNRLATALDQGKAPVRSLRTNSERWMCTLGDRNHERGPRLIRKPRLVDVDAASFDTLPCCGIKSPTHPGRQQKHCLLQANARFGLRAKMLLAPDGQPSGYIEYLPGEFAWRGVEASGFMFIHCVWTFSKQHQRKGWGSVMVEDCLDDARKAGMRGAAVMVRDGPWLADRRLFLANGFEPVDTAPPDYQLLVRKFDRGAVSAAFKSGWDEKLRQYGRGLTVIRSSQCPHIAKFADEIVAAAENEYHVRPTVINLESCSDAQNAPTPYAVFALIYSGRLLADHQISRTRFRNVMSKCVMAGLI